MRRANRPSIPLPEAAFLGFCTATSRVSLYRAAWVEDGRLDIARFAGRKSLAAIAANADGRGEDFLENAPKPVASAGRGPPA
jgi:hypothetical protein